MADEKKPNEFLIPGGGDFTPKDSVDQSADFYGNLGARLSEPYQELETGPTEGPRFVRERAGESTPPTGAPTEPETPQAQEERFTTGAGAAQQTPQKRLDIKERLAIIKKEAQAAQARVQQVQIAQKIEQTKRLKAQQAKRPKRDFYDIIIKALSLFKDFVLDPILLLGLPFVGWLIEIAAIPLVSFAILGFKFLQRARKSKEEIKIYFILLAITTIIEGLSAGSLPSYTILNLLIVPYLEKRVARLQTNRIATQK